MKISSTLIFVTLLVHTLGFSQDLIFSKPVKFGSQINSNGEEINPLMSNDGKVLYFVRAFHPKNTGGQYAGSDIWVSNRNGRGWQASTNKIKNWNNRENNSVIGISTNNSKIYLLDAYSKKTGISFSEKSAFDWNVPKLIPISGVNASDFVGYYMNPDQNVLFISMKGKTSVGQEDIYVSLKDSLSGWSEPVNVGSSINTEGFEISPFLSEDKKRLYFSSNGHPGLGDADIYVSERLYDSWTVWSKPKNLGNIINSEKFDSYFSIYGDSLAFFSSNRDSDLADIYQVKVDRKKVEAPAKDQMVYLTDDEIRPLTARLFRNTLTFNDTSVELTPAHKEQLNSLVGILIRNRDIRARLFVKSTTGQDERERFQARLLSVLNFLKTAGVEGARISFGSDNDPAPSTAPRDIVVIKLHR